MDEASKDSPLGWAVDIAAAAIFAAAVGFAASAMTGSAGGWAAGGAPAFLAAVTLLRHLPTGRAGFGLPGFDVASMDPECDELLLTPDMGWQPALPKLAAGDELLLDDVLAQLEPDARVVRLFDPARMPTAGELQARIERHIGAGSGDSSPADATQALSDALAELRRSLR